MFCLPVLDNIMTSYHILGGSLLTPIWDILQQFWERDDKIFSKEIENLIVKIEFLEDPSTNRNDFESVKDFQGSKEDRGTSSGNKRKYTKIKEPDPELAKNVTINLKIPKNSSSRDPIIKGKKGKSWVSQRKKIQRDLIHIRKQQKKHQRKNPLESHTET